jgi:hypothetical protein
MLGKKFQRMEEPPVKMTLGVCFLYKKVSLGGATFAPMTIGEKLPQRR